MRDTYSDKQRSPEEAVRDLPALHEVLIIHERWELGNSLPVEPGKGAALQLFNRPGCRVTVSVSNGSKWSSREDKLQWVCVKGSEVISGAQKAGGDIVRETASAL